MALSAAHRPLPGRLCRPGLDRIPGCGLGRPGSSALPRRRARCSDAGRARAALDVLGDATAVLQAQHLWDTAVGTGLPCTIQACGDTIYRSTLDPKLRLEETNIFTNGGWTVLGVLIYIGFSITPKPGIGFIDYYILDKLSPRRPKKLSISDFKFTAKLGEGGFGSVYRAQVLPSSALAADGLKEEEEWMNRRMMRAHPEAGATFVQSFKDNRLPPSVGDAPTARPFAFEFEFPKMPWDKKEEVLVEDPVWLVWKLEGTRNLANVINSKEFPYDMEVPILGRELSELPRGPARKAVTIKALFTQVLKGLGAMHDMGIVHRDVKCENMVLTDNGTPGGARLKFVDFGGAADLRIGLNYAPKEYLMDPRFAPPEQYIMSTQTAEPPAVPVALVLSPILWQLNLPDRFDMWSAGLVLLQMCLPSLRPDNSLIAMRRFLDRHDQDVVLWREQTQKPATMKAEDQEGWDILDANDGVGWELVQALLKSDAVLRPCAAQVRRHPFMTGKLRVRALVDEAIRGITEDAKVGKQSKWVLRRMARSGTEEVGGFTEAQMEKLLALDRVPTTKEAQSILSRYVAQTVAPPEKIGKAAANGKAAAVAANGKAAAAAANVNAAVVAANGKGAAAAANGEAAAAGASSDGDGDEEVIVKAEKKALQPAQQLAAMIGAMNGAMNAISGAVGRRVNAKVDADDVSSEGEDEVEEVLVPEDAPPKRKVTYVTGTRAAIARTGIMQKLNYWGRFGPQETML